MDYTLKIEKVVPKTEEHGSKNERNGGWNKEEKEGGLELGKTVTPQMRGQTA